MVDIPFKTKFFLGGNRVQLFSCEGISLRVFGSSGDKPGQFSSPWGLVVDSEGTIVVADQSTFVSKFLVLTPLSQ